MPSIFDTSVHAGLLGRIARLSPDSPRQWGKMTAAQMQVHIGDQLRIALGTLPIPARPGILSNPLVRWVLIHSPIPWPKGAPTAPQLMNPATAAWETDRAALLAAMKDIADRGESHAWEPHPAFGKLSGHSWGVLMWRHIDHHLRQFSL